MKALQVVEHGRPPQIRDVAVPEPGPGEVLVKVQGAGACHTDLDQIYGDILQRLGIPLPFTLGHEVAGVVAALGQGVVGWEVGQPVVVHPIGCCWRCRECLHGRQHLCEADRSTFALSTGGQTACAGTAEYHLVPPWRPMVAIDGLEPSQAAPLVDAGLTSYNSVKRALPFLHPGSAAVVVGVGGLGHMAIQFLKALSPARVIAVDRIEPKLRFAQSLGADEAVLSDADTSATIRYLTQGRGAHAVLDFVGSDASVRIATQAVRKGGQVIVVGLAGGSFPWTFETLPIQAGLSTTWNGSVGELLEVIELARSGAVAIHVTTYPMEEATTVYERLRVGQIEGRAVFIPTG